MSYPSQLFINSDFLKSVFLSLLLLLPLSTSAGSFFDENFESGDLSKTKNGFRWTGSKNASVTTERSNGGNYSLRFSYPGVPDLKDSFAEQKFVIGGNYPELWIKYDLFIPNNFYHRRQDSGGGQNKFIYLWSGDYSANFTGPGLSIQNWTTGDVGDSKATPKAKGAPKDGGGYLFDKHYHKDSGSPINGAKVIEQADHGKWLTIIIHAKYATSANNDGVFQLWKIRDGQLIRVFDKTDGDWYVPGQPGFEKGYLLGWSSAGFDEETVFYLDNFEISTTPLSIEAVSKPNPPTIN